MSGIKLWKVVLNCSDSSPSHSLPVLVSAACEFESGATLHDNGGVSQIMERVWIQPRNLETFSNIL